MPHPITISILKNPIKNYAWGSKTAIAELTGIQNTKNEPQAELWMGAHASAPSLLQWKEKEISLFDLIHKKPDEVLGEKTAKRFSNKLPFLFKVLAAGAPLSIQVHPNITQARDGFHRDNAAKIPLDAPNRNYKDDNHKPEVICALTPFWAMRGFRKISAILENLRRYNAQSIKSEITLLEKNKSR